MLSRRHPQTNFTMGFNRSLFERASGVREGGGDFQKFKREI